MNEQQTFERIVAESVSELGPLVPSDGAIERTLSCVNRKRQRPRWFALIKEPTMRTNNHLAVGSPAARVAAILVATVLLAVALVTAGIAGQRLLAADDEVIVVAQDGSGDYDTINEAVAAAVDGDEILVMAGEYLEAVRIDKDIILRGEDRDSVVVIVGEGCVIEDTGSNGVTCPAGTPMYDGYWNGVGPYGILVDRAEAHVSDLTVQTRGRQESQQNEALPWAFTAVGGAPTFDRVLAQHVNDAGSVYVHEGSAAAVLNSELKSAVFVDEQSPMTLAGNSVKGVVMVNASGPPLSGSAEAKVHDNELKTLTFAGPVDVARNTFKGAGSVFFGTGNAFTQIGNDEYAIAAAGGDGWSISANEISGRYTGGIRQSGGSGGDVVGNTIVGSGIGIRVTIGPEDRVASNRVEGGDVGIQVGGAGLVEENEVSGARNVGFVIAGDAAVTLTGNSSCDNGQDLVVGTSATPTIDDSNTFCDQG